MEIATHIIQQCISGDRAAQARLYTDSAGYAYSVASRYLSTREDCTDALQEAYAKAFMKLKQYDPQKGPFKFWLRRIVINVCLKHLDRSKLLVVDSDEAPELADDTYLEQIELSRSDIKAMLSQMPERYRIVFMLSVMDGYPHNEIAKRLNITPQTSRSQLTRAKNWLKQHLTGTSKWQAYGLL